MAKPFVNLDEVEFNDVEDEGGFTSRRARFSSSCSCEKQAARDGGAWPPPCALPPRALR